MSEYKFFQMVQGKLENFSPEVPQAAYAGMRRKYAVSKFMRWNAGRLNVWYALLLVGVASATVFTLSTGETQVAKHQHHQRCIEYSFHDSRRRLARYRS